MTQPSHHQTTGRLFVRKTLSDVRLDEGMGLRRALGPWQLTMLGIGCIIGAGVYVMTGVAAANYAGPAVVLSFALAGTLSFAGVFWTIPSGFLSGASAAGGLAAISAVGIIGGFVSPWFIGYLKDLTGDFRWGLGAVGCLAIVAALALYLFGRLQQLSPITDRATGTAD